MFSLSDGEMFEGDIPDKYQKYMKKFISYYREKLYKMWETQNFEVLPPIE